MEDDWNTLNSSCGDVAIQISWTKQACKWESNFLPGIAVENRHDDPSKIYAQKCCTME